MRDPLAAPLKILLILALVIAVSGIAAAENDRFRGRPLTEVLQELQDGGLNLIYSTAVVTDDLVVTVEPQASEPRALLAEMLAPLGLAARPGPGGATLIVKAASPPATGKLKGRVLSTARSAPVARATIVVVEAGMKTTSRPDGTFSLEKIPAGSYTVTTTAASFLGSTANGIEIVAAESHRLVVRLHAEAGYVEEVVVTPSRYSLVQQEQAADLTVDREDIMLVPAIGGDISRVLSILPGIAGPDNSAAFNVRGSEAEDVSLVLDGLELYEPFHLEGFQSPFSFIDSEIVEKVDFLRGGFSADSGDRHGGFIKLSSRIPEDSGVTRIEAGTVNSSISHSQPTDNGFFLVSARAWYPQAVTDTIELENLGLDPTFEDAYVKYSHALSPRTILSAHALLAHDRLRYNESDGNEVVDTDNSSGYLWLRLLRSWSDNVFSDTVLSGGRLDRSRKGDSEPEDDILVVDDERTVDFIGLKHDMSWEISPRHLLKSGLEVRPLDAEYDYASGDPGNTTRTQIDPSGTSIATYAAHRVAFSEKFATEVGLRWDRQEHTDDSQFSPRFNALWRVGPRSALRLGWGHYYQSQRIHELRIEDGQVDFLPAELSEQAELTFQHRFTNGLGLRFDAYYRRLSRVHPRPENLFNPVELFPETEMDRIIVAPQASYFRGVEVLLRGASERPMSWWVSYVWSEAEDSIDGEGTIERSWDQTHAGNFLVAYQWGQRWSGSLSGTVHRGWPATPVSGQIVTLPDGSTEVQPVLGQRNSIRYGTYYRLDAQVGWSIPLSRGRLRLLLQVNNLTDHDNQCCVDEVLFDPQPDGSVNTDRFITNWYGITPSFSILWEF